MRSPETDPWISCLLLGSNGEWVVTYISAHYVTIVIVSSDNIQDLNLHVDVFINYDIIFD